MKLTRDNYYTPEADMSFMSCSQYQSFLECEAETMARIQGRWKGSEDSEAFLVGNYVHSYLESEEAHKQFLNEHLEDVYKTTIDKKSGDVIIKGKYAAFDRADKMISTLVNDDISKKFIDMQGQNEKIMTGELFGLPWRIRMDKYIPERNLIIDYKTCADFYKTDYNPETNERVSFIEAYGYLMRAAVYTAIEKQNTGKETNARFMLICVSKQDIPDKDLFLLNTDAADGKDDRFEYELEQIKKHMQRIYKVKTGMLKPLRCGRCEYCRATKKLKGIKPFFTLSPGFEGDLEEDDTTQTPLAVS